MSYGKIKLIIDYGVSNNYITFGLILVELQTRKNIVIHQLLLFRLHLQLIIFVLNKKIFLRNKNEKELETSLSFYSFDLLESNVFNSQQSNCEVRLPIVDSVVP